MTPGFFLADFVLGINVRVAFLDDWPAGKIVYYVIAFLLGIIVLRRPEWTGKVGLVESGTNVGLITLSVVVWYYAALDAAGTDFGMPSAPSPDELVNFVFSASIAGASYVVARARPRAAKGR